MRQAILVVVLISASFLGGAFVNGPGLSWVQARILRSLGLSETGEIASVDLKAAVNSDPSADASSSAKADTTPVAPVPSLLTAGDLAQKDASGKPERPMSVPKQGSVKTDSPERPSQSRPISTVNRSEPHVESRPAPHDASITPASTNQPAASAPGASHAPALGSSVLDSLAALLPSPANSSPTMSTSVLPSSPDPMALTPSVESNNNWAIIQRRMQTLGVTRFSFDGQPGGRVVFWCLIPLAGRQAVAQRFEAEGDDMMAAAQAALRRVALWRATQPPSP